MVLLKNNQHLHSRMSLLTAVQQSIMLVFLFTIFKTNADDVKADVFNVKGTEDSWEIQKAYNLDCKLVTGDSGPGNQLCTSFTINYIDPSNRKGDGKWFNLIREIIPNKAWKNSEGIEFELAANTRRGWYINWCLIEDDGAEFSAKGHPIQEFPAQFYKLRFPFSSLVCTKQPNRKIDPSRVIAFKIGGGAAAGTLYMSNLCLFEKPKQAIAPFISIKISGTGFPASTLEPGDKAILTLVIKNHPAEIKSAVVEVKDYFGNVVSNTSVDLSKRIHKINIGKLPCGYYEVRSYPETEAKAQNKQSLILTSGTQLKGLYTFAVCAQTENEVISDVNKRGMNSFFGIQNIRDQFGAALYTGAPWKISMPRWNWDEPVKPVIDEKGLSEKTREILSGKKKPDYMYNICSFVHHSNNIPGWAKTKRTDKNKIGIKDTETFKSYIKNIVIRNKYLYSHMASRPYELTWEPDLSGPNYSKNPPFWTANDTVQFYKDYAPQIKENDVNAIILGPKATFNIDYIEETFKLGLGKYIDAISMHMYSTPVPEEGDIPGKVRKIRQLAKQYIGKNLDIYNTEAGYHSRINGVNNLKGQAQKLMRYSLIMQGEGVKAFLMFYLFDHGLDDYGTWGLYFNPRENADFSPKELMPKPVAVSYSVLTSLLRGAKPVMNLRWMGTDIWGYVFERDGKPTIALWTPYTQHDILFPVGDVHSVDIVNIMGEHDHVDVKNGSVPITISPNVCYILGADVNIWLNNKANVILPDHGVKPFELYVGDSKTIELDLMKIDRVKLRPDLTSKINGKKIEIIVSQDSIPGIVPILIKSNNQKFVYFAKINPPLVIDKSEIFKTTTGAILSIPVRNTSMQKQDAEITLKTKAGINKQKISVDNKSTKQIQFDISNVLDSSDPLIPFSGQITLQSEKEIVKKNISETFLAAFKNGNRHEKSIFADSVTLTGVGSSGKNDIAEVSFKWDSKGLNIVVSCHDDKLTKPEANSELWRMDSIQMAFDTDPMNEVEYDELTARTSKKVTSIGIALTDKGPYAYRHLTYNAKSLKLGDITNELDMKISRSNNVTTYDIMVPWKQIGTDVDSMRKNGKLGFSLLVNDKDDKQMPRKVLPLFGGIYDNSGWRNYGVLNIK